MTGGPLPPPGPDALPRDVLTTPSTSSSSRARTTTASRPAPAADGCPSATAEPLGKNGWLAIAAITVVTAAVMLPGIGSKSLWRDEGFTASTVLRPWDSLIDLLLNAETNAWLHAVMLKVWSGFGTGPAVLRSLSAVGVLLSIPAIALAAHKLANRRVAIVAALLLAAQGSVFFYGQQIRAYAFVVLFTILAALAFTLEVRRPSRGALVGYVLASLALTSMNVAASAVIVCMAASLVVLPREQRHWRRRLGATAVVLGLTLPMVLLISTHNEGGLYEVGLGTFWDVAMVLTGRSGLVGIIGAAILGILALRSTHRVYRQGGTTFERWVHAFCLLWVVGPFVLAVAVMLFEPVLSGRYMMVSVPGICVYGAIGLVEYLSSWSTADVRGRWLRAGAVAAAAIASLAGLALWLRGGEVEDWHGAARYVFTQAQEGDEVLFANDSVRLFFEYYRTEDFDDPPTVPVPAYPSDPWGEYETGDHRYLSFTADDVRAAAGRADRIWVVVGRDHVSTDRVDEDLQVLAGTHELASRTTFNGRVEVLRYDRTG